MAHTAFEQENNENPTKQEARSARSRKRLLDAAVHIIQTRGVAKLSVRAICAEAGLSTGTFYNLFDSKEDVINYYLIYTFNRYKQDTANKLDGLSATEKILRLYHYFIETCEEVGWEFMSAYYTPTNPILDYHNRPHHVRVVLEECIDYLKQGQRDGEISLDADIDQTMLDITIFISGVMFYWCVFKGELDARATFDRRIMDYLEPLRA